MVRIFVGRDPPIIPLYEELNLKLQKLFVDLLVAASLNLWGRRRFSKKPNDK